MTCQFPQITGAIDSHVCNSLGASVLSIPDADILAGETGGGGTMRGRGANSNASCSNALCMAIGRQGHGVNSMVFLMASISGAFVKTTVPRIINANSFWLIAL